MFEYNSAGDETPGMASLAGSVAPYLDEGEAQDDDQVDGNGWGFPDGQA